MNNRERYSTHARHSWRDQDEEEEEEKKSREKERMEEEEEGVVSQMGNWCCWRMRVCLREMKGEQGKKETLNR